MLEQAFVHNGICLNAPAIIFGADVIHPTTGEDSSAFIAAVVASMEWPQVMTYNDIKLWPRHKHIGRR